MNRRRVLAGLVGVGLTGGAGYVAAGGLGASSSGGRADASGTSDGSTLPVTVATLDAPGSRAGERRIPVRDGPTLVDLFATWCAPCSKQMASLGAVYDDFGDDVTFVSVTNERFGGGLTAGDVREWWDAHDGRWTVGHDPDSTLMSVLGATGLPYLVLFDAAGTVSWSHRGVAAEGTLRTHLRGVLDG